MDPLARRIKAPTHFEHIPVATVKRRMRAILKVVPIKPKGPKREDAAQSVFRTLQHVIDTTEGQKPAPKRKPR